jgi:hypothetical protein
MPDVIGRAQQRFQAEATGRDFGRAAALLVHYMRNIELAPSDSKFRQIHSQNQAFVDRIGTSEAAGDLMAACGWEQKHAVYVYDGDAAGKSARATVQALQVLKGKSGVRPALAACSPNATLTPPRLAQPTMAAETTQHRGDECVGLSAAMCGLALGALPAAAAEVTPLTPAGGRRRHPAASPRIGRVSCAEKRERPVTQSPSLSPSSQRLAHPRTSSPFMGKPGSITPSKPWQLTVEGWVLEAPGSLWGEYADDKETVAWSKENCHQLFSLIVRGWEATEEEGASSYGPGTFTIQYADEPSFGISFNHLWEYLSEQQRHQIVSAGGTEPSAYEAAILQSKTLH